ncbi:TRP-interacting helix domain-containing protein [Ditylenchus destructor]|nr:TRP-interacting helix domain-containing protein [Ditylenchus destructor]
MNHHHHHHSSTLRSYTSTSSGRLRGAIGAGSRRKSGALANHKVHQDRNWIRVLTVCGYIFFVSSPAVFLSYFYTKVWDPRYVNKLVNPPVYPYKTTQRSAAIPTPPSMQRPRRDSPEAKESLSENSDYLFFNDSIFSETSTFSGISQRFESNPTATKRHYDNQLENHERPEGYTTAKEDSNSDGKNINFKHQSNRRTTLLEDVIIRRLPAD